MAITTVELPDGDNIKKILNEFNDFAKGQTIDLAIDAISASLVQLHNNASMWVQKWNRGQSAGASNKPSNTAKIAYDEYAKIGLVSTAGALSVGAVSMGTNIALAEGAAGSVTGMAIGSVSPWVALAAILPLFGFAITDAKKIPKDVATQLLTDILKASYSVSPFVQIQGGDSIVPVLMDVDGNMFFLQETILAVENSVANVFNWTPYENVTDPISEQLQVVFPDGVGTITTNIMRCTDYSTGVGVSRRFASVTATGSLISRKGCYFSGKDSLYPYVMYVDSSIPHVTYSNNPATSHYHTFTKNDITVYYVLGQLNGAVNNDFTWTGVPLSRIADSSFSPKINIANINESELTDDIIGNVAWEIMYGGTHSVVNALGIGISRVTPKAPSAVESKTLVSVVGKKKTDGTGYESSKWSLVTVPEQSQTTPDGNEPNYDSKDDYDSSQSSSSNASLGGYIPGTVPTWDYPPNWTIPKRPGRTAPLPGIEAPDYGVKADPARNPSIEREAVEVAEHVETLTPESEGDSPPYVFPPPGIPFPSAVSQGSGLIHVYNPTPQELINFGKWMWVHVQDGSYERLWNNPFDGVIGAFELYAKPTTEGTDVIRSGFLASDISAKLVRVRYTTINCGSIAVPEYYGNYLDYAPYTKVHAYLPFIGIVELNSDDIIGHGVNITYHIDAYNGSCIAQINVAKENYTNTMYQFSGSCSVEMPLAGGSQASIKAALMFAGATSISSTIGGIASMLNFTPSGIVGGIGQILGGRAQAAAQSVSAKSSVQHSGMCGDSCGAMGIKKPYLMIKRPVQKGVVNYNEIYGFPAHKAVRVGACKGFLRVLEVHVESSHATNEEKAKIEQMLKEGIIV